MKKYFLFCSKHRNELHLKILIQSESVSNSSDLFKYPECKIKKICGSLAGQAEDLEGFVGLYNP